MYLFSLFLLCNKLITGRAYKDCFLVWRLYKTSVDKTVKQALSLWTKWINNQVEATEQKAIRIGPNFFTQLYTSPRLLDVLTSSTHRDGATRLTGRHRASSAPSVLFFSGWTWRRAAAAHQVRSVYDYGYLILIDGWRLWLYVYSFLDLSFRLRLSVEISGKAEDRIASLLWLILNSSNYKCTSLKTSN